RTAAVKRASDRAKRGAFRKAERIDIPNNIERQGQDWRIRFAPGPRGAVTALVGFRTRPVSQYFLKHGLQFRKAINGDIPDLLDVYADIPTDKDIAHSTDALPVESRHLPTRLRGDALCGLADYLQ